MIVSPPPAHNVTFSAQGSLSTIPENDDLSLIELFCPNYHQDEPSLLKDFKLLAI